MTNAEKQNKVIPSTVLCPNCKEELLVIRNSDLSFRIRNFYPQIEEIEVELYCNKCRKIYPAIYKLVFDF